MIDPTGKPISSERQDLLYCLRMAQPWRTADELFRKLLFRAEWYLKNLITHDAERKS